MCLEFDIEIAKEKSELWERRGDKGKFLGKWENVFGEKNSTRNVKEQMC